MMHVFSDDQMTLILIHDKHLFMFQFAKVIEPKRSQAIGILLSSLRLEFYVVENGMYN